MRAFASALALILVGCSAVLGADFDRPAKSDPPAPPSGPAPVSSTVPVGPDGKCPSARKRCGDACASVDDPAYGCGADTCAACAAPADGTATCSATLTCELTCKPGFEKVAGKCVGWHLERINMPQLTAVHATSLTDFYVAGGNGIGHAQIFHSAGDGNWTQETLQVDNDRSVYNFAATRKGEIFLATESKSFNDANTDMLPILTISPSKERWNAIGVGDPAKRVLGIAAPSKDDLWTVDGNAVRHYAKGVWTLETTDIADGFRIWSGGSGIAAVIGRSGAVAWRDWETGKWLRVFTPSRTVTVNGFYGNDSEAWLVGDGGLIMHSGINFGDFAFLESGTTEDLNDVITYFQDVWVVGRHGTILRATIDDKGSVSPFQRVVSGSEANLRAIGGSAYDLYAVGQSDFGDGHILHRHQDPEP